MRNLIYLKGSNLLILIIIMTIGSNIGSILNNKSEIVNTSLNYRFRNNSNLSIKLTDLSQTNYFKSNDSNSSATSLPRNPNIESISEKFILNLINSKEKNQIEFMLGHKLDVKNIINRHDFSYILKPNNDFCENGGKNLSLLVYVHTRPSSYKNRIVIRETWAKRSIFNDIRIVFMTGYSSLSKENNLLRLENNIYNDIIQEDFIDSYRNLTYKAIMAFKWISENCPDVNYILKTDDDILINTFAILRHIEFLKKFKPVDKKRVMCKKKVREPVQRDGKWKVTYEEYQGNYYVPHCPGFAMLLTGDLARLFYIESFFTKFFWIDDIYFSGMLREKINATLDQYGSIFNIFPNFDNGKGDGHVIKHIVSNGVTLNSLVKIWNYLLKYYSQLLSEYGFDISH